MSKHNYDHDPDFKAGSSSATLDSERVLRSQSNNQKSNPSIDSTSDETLPDLSKIDLNVSSDHSDESFTIASAEISVNVIDNVSLTPTYASVLSQGNTMTEAEKQIRIAETTAIVKSILEANQYAQRSSIPKLDVPKLGMHNYKDWSKKMSYALKLQDLWIDPESVITDLSPNDAIRNGKAGLYMGLHLDDKNSAFINESNEKCFITVWNTIKRFYQPRTATVLTDVYIKLQASSHKSGQSMPAHLMKLEDQFARMEDVGMGLPETHRVALILASVNSSSEYANVRHSAMWEEEKNLSIAKVKSVLLSTPSNANNEQALQSKRIFNQSKKKEVKTQNTRQQPTANNPPRVFQCPRCRMDNHKLADCTNTNKKKRQAHHVDDDVSSNASEQANQAVAYTSNQLTPTKHRRFPHSSDSTRIQSTSAKIQSGSFNRARLGDRNNKSPYHNILPQRSNDALKAVTDDILDIHFGMEDDSDDYTVNGNSNNSRTKLDSNNLTKQFFSRQNKTSNSYSHITPNSYELQHASKMDSTDTTSTTNKCFSHFL